MWRCCYDTSSIDDVQTYGKTHHSCVSPLRYFRATRPRDSFFACLFMASNFRLPVLLELEGRDDVEPDVLLRLDWLKNAGRELPVGVVAGGNERLGVSGV
eukprot:scpid39724/ scgid14431/ 